MHPSLGNRLRAVPVLYYSPCVRDFLFQHLLWAFLDTHLNEELELLNPRPSEKLLAGLTWGAWRTTCCTVHLFLLLPGSSFWRKKFVFQRIRVSRCLPQSPTCLRQRWGFWTPASPSKGSRSSRGGVQPPHGPTLATSYQPCHWGFGEAFWNLGPPCGSTIERATVNFVICHMFIGKDWEDWDTFTLPRVF